MWEYCILWVRKGRGSRQRRLQSEGRCWRVSYRLVVFWGCLWQRGWKCMRGFCWLEGGIWGCWDDVRGGGSLTPFGRRDCVRCLGRGRGCRLVIEVQISK